ncbi:MAG TPA: DNA-binding protein [Geminicoccaceae bacterium]|nr:DNA-binding protein [Geminicoccaceae bacterium]
MTPATVTIVDPDAGKVITEVEAADRCTLSVVYLRELRRTGRGPRFVQLTERRIGYRRGDVDAFIEARLQDPPVLGRPKKSTA